MIIEMFRQKPWFGRPKWYFRLVASNGEPIAQSEGYSRRMDCRATAELIASNTFDIVELPL
jgi:uncharacterized protein YegP (UPF0339 family)